MQKNIEDVKKKFDIDILIRGNKFYFAFQFINFLLSVVNVIYIYINKTKSIKLATPMFAVGIICVSLYFTCCLMTKWKSRAIPYIYSIIIIFFEGIIITTLKDPDVFTNVICGISITIVFFDAKLTLLTGIVSIVMLIITMFISWHNGTYESLYIVFIKYYFTFFMATLLTIFISIFEKSIRKSMLNEKVEEYEIDKSKRDNALASKIQEGFLNNEFPSNDVYDICACMIPSKDVGGDFYDFFMIDKSRFAMIVADVSGKGVPAALLMANAKTVIRDYVASGISFEKSMETANKDILCENKEMQFITLFVCIVDLVTGKMNYINAGHVKPFVVDKNGNVSIIVSKPDFIFGVRKDVRYHSKEYMLNPGDRLFLCTDGVTERQNVNNELYGKERVIKTLNENSNNNAEGIIKAMLNSLDKYGVGREQNDDITCLIFDYKKQLMLEPAIEKDFDVSKDKTADIIMFVKDMLKTKNVPNKTINLMAVASDEIISNVAKYAYEDTEIEKKLNVNIQVYNKEIEIIYTDSGKYFNPISKITASGTTKVTDKSKIGGLGIQLTWNIMDDVIYNRVNDKNMIKIKKEY